MNQRLTIVCLCVMFLCTHPWLCFGTTGTEGEKIIYGGGNNYPPYEFINKKGQPEGFHIDLMRAIGQVMGFEVEFKLDKWSAISAQLGQPDGVDITDMFHTATRAQKFAFANAHSVISHHIVTRQGSIEVNTLEHLQGTTVIAESGTALIELLKNSGLNITVELASSEVNALRQLAAGKCDAAVVSQLQALVLIEKYRLNNLTVAGPMVFPLKLSFVANTEQNKLIDKINTGLEILKRTGEYSQIYIKWFGNPDQDNSPLLAFAKWTLIVIGIVSIGAVFWILSLRRLVKSRTERLKHELRIKVDTARALRMKNEELKRKTEELDKFVYSISHDIRSPITSILGLIDLMRIELQDDLAHDYANQIGGSIDKLIHYVDHLLSYWANEREGLNVEPIDFKDVVKEAVSVNSKVEGADKVHVNVEMDISEPFNSDKQRILLILRNLIRNGIEYRSNSETAPYVNLRIKNVRDQLDIEVQDNGEGIDADKQASIFDMFYRGSNKSQGCGLGLYIAREAVKKLGGVVKVQSMPGHGTSFFISLPQMP